MLFSYVVFLMHFNLILFLLLSVLLPDTVDLVSYHPLHKLPIPWRFVVYPSLPSLNLCSAASLSPAPTPVLLPCRKDTVLTCPSWALGCRQTCSLKGGEGGDVRRPHFILLPLPSVSFSASHTRQLCIVYFYEGPWGVTYPAPAATEEEASMGCQCPNVPSAEEVSKRKSLSLFRSGFLTSSVSSLSLVSFPMTAPSSRSPHPPFLLIQCQGQAI